MAEHPNVELLRRELDAFARGDLQAAMDFYSEDIVWRAGGRNALSGIHRGKQQLQNWFGTVLELGGGDAFRAFPVDILADDGFGMVFLQVTARRGDEMFQAMVPNAFRFAAGKIVESWFVPDDQRRFDEFWS